MKFPQFVDQSYRSESTRLGVEETINLYLEWNKTANRKQLYRSPGLTRVWEPETEGPVSVMMLLNGEVWALVGNTVYDFFFSAGPLPEPGYVQEVELTVSQSFGPVLSDGRRSYMVASPDLTQVALVTGARAYLIEGGSLTELTWFGVPVTQVALINNYFLFLSSEDDGFFYSEPGDASDGDALNFRSVESSANDCIALVVDRNVDIWVFGTQTTQIFYNDPNDPNEPFKPNRSGFMETGIASPDCAIAANNRVWWIDENYIVRGSVGYVAERVSTHAIETELRKYGDISNCYAWTVTWNGHVVVRWTFPTPIVDLGGGKTSHGMTWQLDTSTMDWTRQLSWDAISGVYTAHRGMSSCEPRSGKQFVGDRENGAIYLLTPEVQTDDCTRAPWMRRAPIINEEGNNINFAHFELGIETGVGRPLGDFSDTHCNVFPGSEEGEIVSAEFEAVASNGGDESLYIDMKDTDGNIYASLEFPADSDTMRVSAEIDPADLLDDATYYPSFRGGPDSSPLDCYEARLKLNIEFGNGLKTPIWLEMVNAELFNDEFDNEYTAMGRRLVRADYEGENLKIPVGMLTGVASTGGGLADSDLNNWWAYCDEVLTESYGPPSNFTDEDNGHTTIFVKDESKYATILEWELEVTAAAATEQPAVWPPVNDDNAQTGYAALFNKTTGLMVAGSEITFTNPAPTTQTITFANDATNFTDGDEFWVQYKVADNSYYFTLYNVFLSVKLTTPTKARVPLRVSNSLSGGGTESYNTAVRSLFEASRFTTDTIFTLETSARVTAGSDVEVFLFDVGLSDEGAQTVTKDATTGPAITGSWNDEANLVDPSNPPANITLSSSGATAIIEGGDFGFDADLPADAQIRSVSMVVGYGMLGQATASITGYARIGGVDENLHTQAIDESSSTGPFETPPPGELVIMRTLSLNLSADRSWIVDDFLDANFVARVRMNQPANTTSTTYYAGGPIPGIEITVGYGTDVADSTSGVIAGGDQTLYVSDPVTLTDTTRYIVHATSDGSNQIVQSDTFLYAEMDSANVEGGGSGEIPPDPEEQPEFDPLIYMKYSYDWGQTYSNERYRSLGQAGEYNRRVYWDRNGTGRNYVIEVGGSAAVRICIDQAWIGDPQELKGE